MEQALGDTSGAQLSRGRGETWYLMAERRLARLRERHVIGGRSPGTEYCGDCAGDSDIGPEGASPSPSPTTGRRRQAPPASLEDAWLPPAFFVEAAHDAVSRRRGETHVDRSGFLHAGSTRSPTHVCRVPPQCQAVERPPEILDAAGPLPLPCRAARGQESAGVLTLTSVSLVLPWRTGRCGRPSSPTLVIHEVPFRAVPAVTSSQSLMANRW
jgi:hypothetical protein